MLDFLPKYHHLTPSLLLLFAVAGALGALVRVAWLDKPLRGVYRDEATGGLRLGFLGEIICGIAVAIAIDGNPVRAGVAAVFAPWIMDAIKNQLLARGVNQSARSVATITETDTPAETPTPTDKES